ncbi:universal stress protein [Iamia sp. SCSIO 61187]|uniref:universal stress protein n=1 Tax=Iamia sp. SCSIO 61187 TaxID=2722752 RepID=UPI001C62A73B|nr:universal stress protein [Iamia sp. SCSIO 61187]QYG93515.1 universal stress protein [Iamia sp. SCSIO 61187]
MITSIVVPVSDAASSERSIPVAGALARMTGATLELVGVDPVGLAPERTQRRLDEVAATVPPGVAVSTTVEDTVESVAATLAHLDRDPGAVMCLATRGRGALLSLALGSVTVDVVRESAMPALVLGPACTASTPADLSSPAVLALDGTEIDDDVMAAAVLWSRATGAPLVVTTTITRPSEPDAWTDADRIVAWAEERAAQLGLTITSSLSAAADAEEGILRAVEGPVGCYIVGSHRRSRLGRTLLGSTVTGLAQQALCPLLVAPAGAQALVTSPDTTTATDG